MERINRERVAQALKDVVQRKQSGDYRGPRELSDQPVRSVIDLSAYRPPVVPTLSVQSIAIPSGDNLFLDLGDATVDTAQFTEPRNPDRFSFTRFFKGDIDIGGSSGTAEIRIQIYDYSRSVVNQVELYRSQEGSGSASILQYNYDAKDQNGPADQIVPPPDLVMKPTQRLILLIQNNTDGGVTGNVISSSYLFKNTDILI